MKRINTIVLILLVSIGGLHAQAGPRSIKADDISMARSGENVTVSFTLTAGRKTTKAGYDLVVNPVLRSGVATTAAATAADPTAAPAPASASFQCPLPSVIIRGRRSKVLDARHELATGKRHYGQVPQYMRNGESLEYTATVPYESWMGGGQLVFEGVSVGCCTSAEAGLWLVADNILDAGPQIETRIMEIRSVLQHTTGDRLAEQYPFVAPASEFALIEQVLQQPRSTFESGRSEVSQQIIAEIRQGSVSVFFGQGLRTIDSNFGDNNRNLVELISAVRALASARDSGVAAIVIAGFASPEGSPELNDRLAWDRAVAVKEFLTKNSDVDPGTIRIFSGGADWARLRELVERSDLYQKQRIIDIIDNTPVWDPQRNVGRLGELMRLDGGEPYRYMFTNFFPELRQAAYIKIYYKD